MSKECPSPAQAPIRYVVTQSKVPGIFNLGGDLPLFIRLIRRQDRAALHRYDDLCVEDQYLRAITFGLPIINLSLVQGEALGGGFECALSDDLIIAERGAGMGLQEVLFNMFPGMGAFSFLSHRLDATRARSMILEADWLLSPTGTAGFQHSPGDVSERAEE